MSRSQTPLPPSLAQRYPVLIAASVKGHEDSIDGFIWLPEYSPEFIAGRIAAAASRYHSGELLQLHTKYFGEPGEMLKILSRVYALP